MSAQPLLETLRRRCRALTAARTPLVPSGIKLADNSQPFWVLVRGEAGDDGLLDASGVQVDDAGGYSPSGNVRSSPAVSVGP